jgi:ribonuclease E
MAAAVEGVKAAAAAPAVVAATAAPAAEVRAAEEARAVAARATAARATAVEEVTAPAAAPVVQESPAQTPLAPVKQTVKLPPIRQIP